MLAGSLNGFLLTGIIIRLFGLFGFSMERKHKYSYEDLVLSGRGKLFGEGRPQLPIPPMLMFDRITRISDTGGSFEKGVVVAEFDIDSDLWFFNCHFHNDPVMPGCLGLDGMWQLLGFFMGWMGAPGYGRALGVDMTKFTGQIAPTCKLITYTINIKRILSRELTVGIADGEVDVDGKTIYTAKNLRVALFKKSNRF